jgi:hypothetical protein
MSREREPVGVDAPRRGPPGVEDGGAGVADQGVDEGGLVGELGVVGGEPQRLLDRLHGAVRLAEVGERLGLGAEALPVGPGAAVRAGDDLRVEGARLAAPSFQEQVVGEVEGGRQGARLELERGPQAALGLAVAAPEEQGDPQVGEGVGVGGGGGDLAQEDDGAVRVVQQLDLSQGLEPVDVAGCAP